MEDFKSEISAKIAECNPLLETSSIREQMYQFCLEKTISKLKKELKDMTTQLIKLIRDKSNKVQAELDTMLTESLKNSSLEKSSIPKPLKLNVDSQGLFHILSLNSDELKQKCNRFIEGYTFQHDLNNISRYSLEWASPIEQKIDELFGLKQSGNSNIYPLVKSLSFTVRSTYATNLLELKSFQKTLDFEYFKAKIESYQADGRLEEFYAENLSTIKNLPEKALKNQISDFYKSLMISQRDCDRKCSFQNEFNPTSLSLLNLDKKHSYLSFIIATISDPTIKKFLMKSKLKPKEKELLQTKAICRKMYQNLDPVLNEELKDLIKIKPKERLTHAFLCYSLQIWIKKLSEKSKIVKKKPISSIKIQVKGNCEDCKSIIDDCFESDCLHLKDENQKDLIKVSFGSYKYSSKLYIGYYSRSLKISAIIDSICKLFPEVNKSDLIIADEKTSCIDDLQRNPEQDRLYIFEDKDYPKLKELRMYINIKNHGETLYYFAIHKESQTDSLKKKIKALLDIDISDSDYEKEDRNWTLYRYGGYVEVFNLKLRRLLYRKYPMANILDNQIQEVVGDVIESFFERNLCQSCYECSKYKSKIDGPLMICDFTKNKKFFIDTASKGKKIASSRFLSFDSKTSSYTSYFYDNPSKKYFKIEDGKCQQVSYDDGILVEAQEPVLYLYDGNTSNQTKL